MAATNARKPVPGTSLPPLARHQPTELFMQMEKEDWHTLTEEQYRTLFKGSAVKRAKYAGLMRNIHQVESNE